MNGLYLEWLSLCQGDTYAMSYFKKYLEDRVTSFAMVCFL